MKEYIIAVSAGPDSMALLNKYKKHIKVVCHVNYHDREDTDNDQMILENYCIKHNLKLVVFDTEKDDVSEYFNDKNPQTFYRKIRYDFFNKIANQEKVYDCLIGHHKDDFIETAMMAIQEKKDRFYLGIRKKSNYKDLILHRPLLKYWKDELEDYCKKNKIEYAVDYSNFSSIYKRNDVRKDFKLKTIKEKKQFYRKIQLINLKNYFFCKKSESLYKKWKLNNYNRNTILKLEDKYNVSLIYLLLSELSINVSKNKISEIIKFIKSFNGSNKRYRVKENLFLCIKNKCIVFEG